MLLGMSTTEPQRRRSIRSPLVLAASLFLVMAATAGCGDQSKAGSPSGDDASVDGGASTRALPSTPSTGEPESGSCGSVIEPSVIAALGWDSEQGAVEGRGGCVWEGDDGSVTVFKSAETFDEACDRLKGVAPDGTFEPTIEDAGPSPTCGYVRPTGLGASEFVVELDDQVVSITVASLQTADPDAVRAALVSLSATADEL